MIGKLKRIKRCCRNYKDVENYIEAINSTEKYELHHKLGLVIPRKTMIKIGIYYNRPAIEFIFLPVGQHRSIHNTGKEFTLEHRKNISKSKIGTQAGENNPFYGDHRFTGKNNPRYRECDEKQIRELVQMGYCKAQISKITGIPPTTLRRKLIEYKIIIDK